MSTPNTPMPLPHCPHCNAELAGLGLFHWQHQGFVIISVYCGTCMKTLHFQVVPMVPAGEESRIAMPH